MVSGLIAASLLTPFFVEVTPEIRSTYQSLGKIVEDRPMQIMSVRAGFDTGKFGRFGIRNWDVSSLTSRRADVHRRALYHTEFGPTWQYGYEIAEGVKLNSDLTYSWTIYRGFENRRDDRTYVWAQIDQSLENPCIVPFYRLRYCFHGNDYLYFKAGLRKRFRLGGGFYITPSVYTEGGSSRNQKRVLGARRDGSDWYGGVSSVSGRLEIGWMACDNITAFAYVEQYGVVGGEARRSAAKSSYKCSHSDWTHGGVGLRMKF